MRLTLVGADLEENLGMGMIAASAGEAGHRVEIVPFTESCESAHVVERVLASAPDVVGLAAQFQHRGAEFLALAAALRRAGFAGHITAGGHFASMGYAQVLSARSGVNSVVLYEGEQTIVELLNALAEKRDLTGVAGLAFLGPRGVLRTATRNLAQDLDALPTARRYRAHTRHLGVPFVPISGSRGCWARCSFCSITSQLRDAREHGAQGRLLRLRSPENLASEMIPLAHAVGDSAIFCFHDENFLLPRPEDTLTRVSAIKQLLDAAGMGRVGFVGKCRPDTLTPELAHSLAELGVIRLYVGVENASQAGADHLNRRVRVQAMDQGLQACRDAGIAACYNLLLFEPETTLDDVADNIAFIRRHPEQPVNFCRAEPYLGTPLLAKLAQSRNLSGSFLGWDYRIVDDRAELLFRMCAAAFRQRNFATEGVANRCMGITYSARVLDYFYRAGDARKEGLRERAITLTRNISLDTAELLEQALDLAGDLDPHDGDAVARATAVLGLKIAAMDQVWHAALDSLRSDMNAFTAVGRRIGPLRRLAPGQVARVAQGAAVAGWLALGAPGCSDSDGLNLQDGGKRDTSTVALDASPPDTARGEVKLSDPLPPDAAKYDVMMVDMIPPDAGKRDVMVYDPLPPDAARPDLHMDPPPPDAGRDVIVLDPLPPDARPRDVMMVDMIPPDAGRPEIRVYDPVPPDAGRVDTRGPDGKRDTSPLVDPVPAPNATLVPSGEQGMPSNNVLAYWADTAPKRSERDPALPLSRPPDISLNGTWVGDTVDVSVQGTDEPLSLRWESQGAVVGTERRVTWTPASDQDQLNLAVRGRDGVAVAELRLCQVAGRRQT
jgi:anaerobic magnesium-protoporphyrin IX monomethyl ester cyclase